MKEKFSAEEWEELQKLPVMVFLSVALTDSEISDAETESLLREVNDAVRYREPLLREIFFDLATGDLTRLLPVFMDELNDPDIPIEAMVEKRKTILRAHLTNEEYHRFIFSLIGFGKTIGDVSGGVTDDAEWGRLFMIGQWFELDMQVGKAALDALPGGSPTPAPAPAMAASAPSPGTGKKHHWWSHKE